MAEKKAVARETRAEYRKATKTGKVLILNRFVQLTWYNRKYAIRLPGRKELAELAALNRVYESLCPLLNFFIPNKRLFSKATVGSRTVKTCDKSKTSYRRLMESSLPEKAKAKPAAERALYNPVELQYKVNKAIDGLLAAHKAKVTFSK